ncbi:MAG: amidohydrolase family protein [Chromatiales bacterium]|nr:amidohydrolase family protein [Chromatiales bacterium]
MQFDAVINNGRFFDGTGAAGQDVHLGVRDGKLVAISSEPFAHDAAPVAIDARERWVMPGFIDTHTHYDAELIAAPGLTESVRHGVTTVTVGSCSISMVLSQPEDCADLFTRVESVPREQVLPLLRERKHWSSPGEWVDFLSRHPLGPNVTSFIGHSDIRVRTLGLRRAVDREIRPDEIELAQMERYVEEALDAGMLGMSTMTTKWDKLDGDRVRSASLPSTYARWSEFRRLNRVLRRRGRVHQGAPDIVTKYNMFLFFGQSMGLLRAPLKTALISLMDVKSNRLLARTIGKLATAINTIFNADFRWQALPNRFDLYADGMDLVIFEEFGAGQAALHLKDALERNNLLGDEEYRRWFRRDYDKRFGPRVWHRDFRDSRILACPDASVIGKSFAEVGTERNIHPVDAFLDLVVAYGTALRWYTVIANDDERILGKIIADRGALIGFADSGAHIRNMAFYNSPLRMLRLVRDAELRGEPIMPVEKAVWRLTGELADWYGIEAGHLRLGDRADIVVINPAALDERLEGYHEAPMAGLGEIERLVNRNDAAVDAVLINGRLAWRDGKIESGVGSETGFGRFLAAA